jgi:O-antigen/teichoic acid export membrane protein
VLMAPLQLALFPICMKLWNAEGKKATQEFLSRSLDQFMLVAVVVVCVAIATSRDVILVLASKKFQQAHTLLPFLVIGLVLSAVTIYFRPGLLIHKRASKIARATFYAGILNIALNIVLLPRIGLIGAAIATVVSYAGIVVFLAFESLRVLSFKLHVAAFLRYSIVGAAVAWSAMQVPMENPFFGAMTKASVIVALYAGILCLIDPQVRTLFSKAWTMAATWLRRSPAGAIDSLPAVSERT